MRERRWLVGLSLPLFAAIVLLTGCASLPADAPRYTRAPMAPAGYATVYFYRLGAYPSKRTPDVVVEEAKVYAPPEKAYTWTYVKAGSRAFGVEWSWDTGAPSLHFTRELAAGQSYFIKISGNYSFSGFQYEYVSSARLVPYIEAEAELAMCCGYVPAEQRSIP